MIKRKWAKQMIKEHTHHTQYGTCSTEGTMRRTSNEPTPKYLRTPFRSEINKAYGKDGKTFIETNVPNFLQTLETTLHSLSFKLHIFTADMRELLISCQHID